MAATQRWHIHCTDFEQAYLNGTLDHDVYMKPPEGIQAPPGKVFKIVKGLYGLKQSGRLWNQELDRLPLVTYVDDVALMSRRIDSIEEGKAALQEKFKLEDKGEIRSFCAIQLDHDRHKGELRMHQKPYIGMVLDRATSSRSTV